MSDNLKIMRKCLKDSQPFMINCYVYNRERGEGKSIKAFSENYLPTMYGYAVVPLEQLPDFVNSDDYKEMMEQLDLDGAAKVERQYCKSIKSE